MRRSPRPAQLPAVLALVLTLVVATAVIAPARATSHQRAGRATTISGWAAAPTSVTVGSSYVAQVRVSGGRRTVELQRLVATRWRTVATTRSSETGRATLSWSAPASALAAALRVRVPRTPRHAAATTARKVVAVTPSVTGTGQQVLTPVLQEVLLLVNRARSSARTCGGVAYPAVAPLRAQAALGRAAEDYARLMATRDFFSHTSPDGDGPGDRIERAGYRWRAYGENIAAGQGSADQVVHDWLASPGHCANLMNGTYREIGLGHAYDDDSTYGHYWVQDFGTPR